MPFKLYYVYHVLFILIESINNYAGYDGDVSKNLIFVINCYNVLIEI